MEAWDGSLAVPTSNYKSCNNCSIKYHDMTSLVLPFLSVTIIAHVYEISSSGHPVTHQSCTPSGHQSISYPEHTMLVNIDPAQVATLPLCNGRFPPLPALPLATKTGQTTHPGRSGLPPQEPKVADKNRTIQIFLPCFRKYLQMRRVYEMLARNPVPHGIVV